MFRSLFPFGLFFLPKTFFKGEWRSFDGSGNSPSNANWGKVKTPLTRAMAPNISFADGIGQIGRAPLPYPPSYPTYSESPSLNPWALHPLPWKLSLVFSPIVLSDLCPFLSFFLLSSLIFYLLSNPNPNLYTLHQSHHPQA